MKKFTTDDVSDGEVHMANKILEINEEYEKFGLSVEERLRAIKVAHKQLEVLYGADDE